MKETTFGKVGFGGRMKQQSSAPRLMSLSRI